jgi:hypothetical protein
MRMFIGTHLRGTEFGFDDRSFNFVAMGLAHQMVVTAIGEVVFRLSPVVNQCAAPLHWAE